MKVVLSIVIFYVLLFCTVKTPKDTPPDYVLDHHRNFSSYTNPSEFAYLYNDLPTSINDLCQLIKKQLIHPFDVDKFSEKIPKSRKFEDRDFPTVLLMLEELVKRDETGLTSWRKPDSRLVVACVHHSMLLASILRHRDIPVRIRSGFAKYIGDRKDLRVSHVICEVWDQENSRWILIDPDRQKINFSRNEFEFAYETWALIRSDNLGSARYVSRYGNVDRVTVHLLIHDLSYIIGDEEPYWEDPSIVSKIENGISDLSENELHVFDKIAGYLKNPDDHLKDLEKIISENEFLQIQRDM